MEFKRKKTPDVYLLLGSNLGDRQLNMDKAKDGLQELGAIVRESSVFKTEPWRMQTEDWFFNQVVLFETNLSPLALLDGILAIEAGMGRIRGDQGGDGYTSRIIDIDILYFGNLVIDSQKLSVPHPKIQERRFVLAPMVELAPSFLHPIMAQTQFELLKTCTDDSFLELV